MFAQLCQHKRSTHKLNMCLIIITHKRLSLPLWHLQNLVLQSGRAARPRRRGQYLLLTHGASSAQTQRRSRDSQRQCLLSAQQNNIKAIKTYSHMRGHKHQKIISCQHGSNSRVAQTSLQQQNILNIIGTGIPLGQLEVIWYFFQSDLISYHGL